MSLLVKLSQPVARSIVHRPDIYQVVAYTHRVFYKQAADGQPTVMARRQGRRYNLEHGRLDGKDGEGFQPVTYQGRLDWQDKTEI
ncbi:hypothetical protein PG984_015255 [Apiospora sp. TS-2023a]